MGDWSALAKVGADAFESHDPLTSWYELFCTAFTLTWGVASLLHAQPAGGSIGDG